VESSSEHGDILSAATAAAAFPFILFLEFSQARK
jgi:hypothetical protein